MPGHEDEAVKQDFLLVTEIMLRSPRGMDIDTWNDFVKAALDENVDLKHHITPSYDPERKRYYL